jgi:small subunit ribosomal protein S8
MDPISDMLTKIRNAGAVHKRTVSIPYSNFRYQLGKILAKEGFVEDIKKRFQSSPQQKGKIVIRLKYNNSEPRIHEINKISKPGGRVYLKKEKLYLPKASYGMLIISTSKGLLTAREARKQKVGGEVICEVW